jgi:hypothetical protein
MKKYLFILLLVISSLQLFSVYQVGDVVESFGWEHSNGVDPRSTTSIDELVGENKVIALEWSQVWCGPCQATAPHLEEIWQAHGGLGNDELYICAALTQNADSTPLTWELLDGEAWRDEHSLTHWLAMEDLMSHGASDFGVNGIPHGVVIGNGGVLLYSGHPGAPEFEEAIELGIATFSSLYVSSPLENISLAESETTTIDVSNTFSHGAGNEITLSMGSNSDPSIATATLDGTTITIEASDVVGSTEIGLVGTSGEEEIETTFTVTVYASTMKEIRIDMTDGYGDGWGYNGNNNYLEIEGQQVRLEDGSEGSVSLFLEPGAYDYTYYENDGYGAENSWEIIFVEDGSVISSGSGTTNGGGSASADYTFEIPGGVMGSFNGTVEDVDGNPIEGATVMVSSTTATTDASGNYSIDYYTGLREVKCSFNGYYQETATITIEETNVVTLDFRMLEISNAPHHVNATSAGSNIEVEWQAPGNQAITSREVIFDQPVVGASESGWSFGVSDVANDTYLADNFVINGEVSSVSFTGITAFNDGSAWVSGVEDPMSFDIVIYEDDNGAFGEEILNENVSLSGVATGETYGDAFDSYVWTYTFDTPISLSNGWLKVVGTSVNTENDVWFMWGNSYTGDGVSIEAGDASASDRSFSFDGVRNLSGYKVFRNDNMIGETAWNELSFTDDTADVHAGYDYTVKAVYIDGSEIVSEVFTYVATSTDDETINSAVTLSNNYPNPFNPTTNIDFAITKDQNVEIAVYNAKGQKVRTLVKDYLTAGNHSVKWTGIDSSNKPVSSGIYFYKMNIGQQTLTKKMILLK